MLLAILEEILDGDEKTIFNQVSQQLDVESIMDCLVKLVPKKKVSKEVNEIEMNPVNSQDPRYLLTNIDKKHYSITPNDEKLQDQKSTNSYSITPGDSEKKEEKKESTNLYSITPSDSKLETTVDEKKETKSSVNFDSESEEEEEEEEEKEEEIEEQVNKSEDQKEELQKEDKDKELNSRKTATKILKKKKTLKDIREEMKDSNNCLF